MCRALSICGFELGEASWIHIYIYVYIFILYLDIHIESVNFYFKLKKHNSFCSGSKKTILDEF